MTAFDIIRVVGAEFSNVPDDQIRTLIEIYRPMVSRRKFGILYEQALAFLVCHYMKMMGIADAYAPEGSQSQVGSIDDGLRIGSYSEGGVSMSWSMSAAGVKDIDGEFSLTTYGLQYLNLRRLVIVPITIRRPGFPPWGMNIFPPEPPVPPEPSTGTALVDQNGVYLTDELGRILISGD